MNPGSVAIVGASPANERTRDMLGNLRTLGYGGTVFAVNPKYDEVQGYPCAPSLSALPVVPEAVAVGVATRAVPEVVREAASLGVRAAVVFTGGFADGGPDGIRAQAELTALARDSGMAILGPNCQGTVSFADGFALYSQQVVDYAPGTMALVSQSGAVTDSLSTNTRGVRWSHVISCGNEAVVDLADLLAYLVDEPRCRGVCVFAETIRDPARFLSECDRARQAGKPVIVLVPGETDQARAAALSHSGALSGGHRLIVARLARHGVIRVETLEELLATAVAFQTRRRPGGFGVGVVAGSGGVIELILDESSELRLCYPTFAPETQRELAAVVGAERAASNPLDIWPRLIADPFEAYRRIVDALGRDPSIDMLLFQANFLTTPTGTPTRVGRVAKYVSQLRDEIEKPLAVITAVEGQIPAEVIEKALAGDVIPLSGLRSGLRALEHLASFSLAEPEPLPAAPLDTGALLSGIEALGGTATSGAAALELLASCGLQVVRTLAVRDEASAVEAAAELGFPVAVKVGDELEHHKTERGGVALALRDADAVRAAAKRLLALGAETLLVQPQLDGLELILGLEVDQEWGPFLVLGLGGVWTEVLDDVAIRPVGLRAGEAERMLKGLRAAPLLQGARGSAKPDLDPILDAVQRVDAIGQAAGLALSSLEINPLIVTEMSAIAVDALVVPSPREASADIATGPGPLTAVRAVSSPPR